MLKQSWFLDAVVNRLSNARIARRSKRRSRKVRHNNDLESLEPRVVLSASPGTVSPLANLGYVADDGPLQTIHLNTDNDPQGDNPFKYSFGSASPHYGGRNHTILAGDFDGDGVDTVVAVEEVPFYETGNLHEPVHLRWLIDDDRDTTDEFRFRFGLVGDIPLVGDMNGDGIDDAIAVRRGTVPVNGSLAAMTWYVSYGPFPAQNGSAGEFADVDATFVYAFNGDTPIVGDWDGDGVDNLGLVSQQPSADGHFQWYKHSPKTGITVENFGRFSSNNVPITGDFDGDGTDDLAYVERRGTGEAKWYFQKDNDPRHEGTIVFGTSNAQFLVGQWTQPDVRIDDQKIVEGDSGQRNMVFTVSLTAPDNPGKLHPSQVPVSVDFATVDGTARSGGDYLTRAGRLTFQPGQTSQKVTIPIVGDTRVEPTESFEVRLKNAVNGRIADSAGTGTIVDNDISLPVVPNLRIGDASATEGNNLVFNLTLDKPASVPVTVSFRTQNEKATAGEDYRAVNGKVTFAPGETTKALLIETIDDLLDEENETFRVLLSDAQNVTIRDGNAVGTILDNDAPPSIEIKDQSITERNTGRQDMVFTVSLSAASGKPVTVKYQTVDGTAKAGLDYDARQGTLTFTPGETSKTVSVPIIGDIADEPDETFRVQLSSPTNATVRDGSATGRIIDNDPPAPNVARIADASIVEGDTGRKNVEFVVTLTRANNSAVTMTFNTANGTAIAGQDFDAVQGKLTFNAGETRKSIFVTIIGDKLHEPTENFQVRLGSLQNAVFGDGTATGTILNDDDPAPETGSIAGVKWNDLDGDGTRDANEPGLSDWTIYIDQNRNGRLDDGERSTQTDTQGRFKFDDVEPGEYQVSEIVQPGWRQTFPGSGSSEVGGSIDGFSEGRLAFEHSAALTTTASTVQVSVDAPELSMLGEALPQLDKSGSLIGIDDFRNDPRFSDIDGSGFATVIIDTGIDLDHPFFGADADGNGIADRIVYQYDFVNERPDASDLEGHGSHVAGIALSQDGQFTGMAPGADIIALKVLENGGTFADVEQSLQWVVNNASKYNIASVNMSLGVNANYSSAISLFGLGDELRELAEMGVIVVSAAGNSYFNFQSEGVSYPAADPNSLAVSSVFTSDVGGIRWRSGGIDFTTGPDRVVSHSQRHSELTDIFAPGALITSADNNGGTALDGGTSMAAPHVAGVATLAQQLSVETLGRRLTVDEFRTLLSNTGKQIFDGDDENDNVRNTNKNYGRIDVVKLAEAILELGRVNSHVVDVAPGEAVTGVDFGAQKLNPKASIANATPVTGGDASIFTVKLDRNHTETVKVTWQADGLRSRASGTVSFAPGETMQTIQVNTEDIQSDDGQIKVRLTSIDQADIADGFGVGNVSVNPSAVTAEVSFEPASGTLEVSAQSASRISIGSTNDGLVSVSINGISVSGEGVESLSASSVSAIVVTGSSEGDSIDLTGVVPADFTGLERVELAGFGGHDTIIGSEFDDVIHGGAGRDELAGNGGNDLLVGGSGSDTINGGDGDDSIRGAQGRDSLSGDNGDDHVHGGPQADTIMGGAGRDVIRGHSGADRIYGGGGDDIIMGGAGHDELGGDSGDDMIKGQSGRDSIQGGAGADVLVGQTGADTLAGGSGNDVLFGRFSVNSSATQLTGGRSATTPKVETASDFDELYAHVENTSDDFTLLVESDDGTGNTGEQAQVSSHSANNNGASTDVDFIAEGTLLDRVFSDSLFAEV